MRASELAADLIRMVAQHGDQEIGIASDAHGIGGAPISDLEYCMPSLIEREAGAEPRYLIRWWVGEVKETNLAIYVGDDEQQMISTKELERLREIEWMWKELQD